MRPRASRLSRCGKARKALRQAPKGPKGVTPLCMAETVSILPVLSALPRTHARSSHVPLTPRQPVGQIGPVGSPPPSPHCRCFTTISSLFPFPVLFHPPRLFHFIYADVPLTDRHLNNATVRSLDDPSKPSRSRSTSHTSQTVARTRTWDCSSPLGSSACSPLSLSSLCSNRLSCLV